MRRKIPSYILAFALIASATSCLAQGKPDAPVATETTAVSSTDGQNQDAVPASSASDGQASNSSSNSNGPTNPESQQNQNMAPASSAAGQQPDPPVQPNQGAVRDENTKRILGIIPNFQSKDDIPENQAPLTVKEKYILAYHQTVDISAHFGNLFQAMLQQASNGQPHYGQGWGPYAERFGAAEADQVTSAFFIFGFFPHVLHDDPRYFRKRYGSIWSRMIYSASRTVITRKDAGTSTFNIPQVAGQLLQQGISTSYYPPVDRSVTGVFQDWGINLAYNSAYNVLKEFYPDFLRIVFHRHVPEDPAPSSAPPPEAPTKNL